VVVVVRIVKIHPQDFYLVTVVMEQVQVEIHASVVLLPQHLVRHHLQHLVRIIVEIVAQ
jgi:hypothetical protein